MNTLLFAEFASEYVGTRSPPALPCLANCTSVKYITCTGQKGLHYADGVAGQSAGDKCRYEVQLDVADGVWSAAGSAVCFNVFQECICCSHTVCRENVPAPGLTTSTSGSRPGSRGFGPFGVRVSSRSCETSRESLLFTLRLLVYRVQVMTTVWARAGRRTSWCG